MGVVLAVLLAEASLRLFPGLLPFALRADLRVDDGAILTAHDDRASVMAEDNYLGKVLRPDVTLRVEGHPDYAYEIVTHSLGFGEGGFRDDGIGGPVYAVAVGDSFTFGDGVDVDLTWVERLERDTGFDVVNEGVPGYSSIQNMRNEAAYGLPLDPEVVIWAFFGNDPADDWLFQAWLGSGETSIGGWQVDEGMGWNIEEPQEEPHTGLRETLDRSSRVFAVADLAAGAARQRYQPYVDDTLDFRFKFDTVWERYLRPDDERIQVGMELTRFNILEGRRLADERGADFVLVLIPFKEQVYWPIVSRYVRDADAYDVNWMTDAMLDFCEDNSLTCIDLLPPFAQHAGQGEQLYFRTDGHWNEAGHALAADLIREALAQDGLLPEE